jgi:MFS family permease
MATTMEASAGRAFPRLHWGSVIAGVLLALAAHVVMGLIGAALGFAAGASGSEATGAAAAIWALVTPFVATLLGAWLACRLADSTESRSASLHGVLVWCIGLIAGAIFLTGTMATGAMTAGTAASGNATAAQRTLRAQTGSTTPRGPQAQAQAQDAAKGAAKGAGGGALAAIAGLLGGIAGAAISTRRGRGASTGRWRTAFRHDETRAGTIPPAPERGYGTTYGTETRMPPGSATGAGTDVPPPTDPYHH